MNGNERVSEWSVIPKDTTADSDGAGFDPPILAITGQLALPSQPVWTTGAPTTKSNANKCGQTIWWQFQPSANTGSGDTHAPCSHCTARTRNCDPLKHIAMNKYFATWNSIQSLDSKKKKKSSIVLGRNSEPVRPPVHPSTSFYCWTNWSVHREADHK